MPTYQYRCVDCGSELETVQKFSDPSLTECPECDGTLRKVYSAVGVVFKGSGLLRHRQPHQGQGRGSQRTHQRQVVEHREDRDVFRVGHFLIVRLGFLVTEGREPDEDHRRLSEGPSFPRPPAWRLSVRRTIRATGGSHADTD
jgi:putative FmdB family regulatory protein